MKLTLAMIVRNEEAHLGHCLASVRGLVDEIVVVDTGSTDGTVALAREGGAKVIPWAWTEDFSAARNESLAHATGDWVLVLDADEAIDPRDHALIRSACAQAGVDAYRMLIRSYLPDGAYTMMDLPARPNPGGYGEGSAYAHCGETRAVRLFRRAPWVRFHCRVHEQVDPCFLERGLPMPDLDAVIHHYGFTLARRTEAKKPVYLAMARRDAEDRPGDLQSRFHLLIQAAAAEDWALASATAEEYRAAAEARGLPAPPSVLLTQAVALQRQGAHAQAVRTFQELLDVDPDSVPGAVGLGVSLERLGRVPEARRILETCVRDQPGYLTAYLDLADLQVRAGAPALARTVLEAGLGVAPGDPALHARRIRLGLEAGDPGQAVRDAWDAIRACPGGGAGDWHTLVGLFLLRQGAGEEGRQVLAQGLERFPDHPELIRLMGLC